MEGKGEGKREGKGKRDRDALITFFNFFIFDCLKDMIQSR